MALDNYTELRSTIEAYAKRTDMLSYIDTFIDLAETEMWTILKVREMEVRATSTTSTVDRFLALPDGFLSMRKHQILIDSEYFDIIFVPPETLEVSSSANAPTRYTITSQLEFNKVSDQAYTVEMQYYKKLTGLSDTNATNDILTNYPRIYITGCMKYFSEWAREFELSRFWANEFSIAIAKANRQSRKGRYSNPAKFLS